MTRKQILVRFPKDRGITGQAIQGREVIVVNNGESNISFAAEVDNAVGCAIVHNLMVGACYDRDGSLRGVIQLVNKTHQDEITFQDQREFSNLLSIVAEIIRQLDEVRVVGDISANVNLHLTQAGDRILSSARVYEERDMASIYSSFQQIVNRIETFAKTKQINTIKEQHLAQQIFGLIREDEKLK